MPNMRHILVAILSFLFLTGAGFRAKGQEFQLYIDSVAGIPDTIYDGQEITFDIIISLNSPLFYQGAMSLDLEYGGNLYPVDSVVVAGSLLSPSSPNTIHARHRFSTENDLQIGDNVVVVWPRLGNGNEPPQTVINPYTFTVTLVEPNGISDRQRPVPRTLVLPNPGHSEIRLALHPSIDLTYSRLYHIDGHMVKDLGTMRSFDVSDLPAGLYLLDVLTVEGHRYTDRLLISR